jgi:predicted transcriptional regulator
MSKRKSKADIAESLFVASGKTQKEIAEALDVSEQTVSKWANEGNWKARRGAGIISTESVVQKLLAKLDELTKADALKADEVAKIASAIQKIKKEKKTMDDFIEVFMAFDVWLQKQDRKLAEKVNDFQTLFITEKFA